MYSAAVPTAAARSGRSTAPTRSTNMLCLQACTLPMSNCWQATDELEIPAKPFSDCSFESLTAIVAWLDVPSHAANLESLSTLLGEVSIRPLGCSSPMAVGGGFGYWVADCGATQVPDSPTCFASWLKLYLHGFGYACLQCRMAAPPFGWSPELGQNKMTSKPKRLY